MKRSQRTEGILGMIDPDHQFAHTKDLESIIVHNSFRIFFKDDFLNDPDERIALLSLSYIKTIIQEEYEA